MGAGLSYYGVGAFSWCSVVPLDWGGVLGAVGLPGLPWGLGLGGSGGVSRGSHFNFGRVNNP